VKILEPLYDVVTAIMKAFHILFKSLGFDPAGGFAWGMSIVGLVIVIRIVLIPLFVKQIKAQRGLQLLQPEVKKLQAKYKGRTDAASKQAQQQELMKLYRDNGTNPLSSCLPILAQAPIFFALFRVLNGIGSNPVIARGILTQHEAKQAANAEILGVHISDQFLGSDSLHVQVVCALMIIAMSATTFTTQRQLMRKNMPAAALDNPFAQQQKILLYVFPLIFAVSGVNFPLGVLLYWLTTNVWTMCQQFYVIRRNPAPGSPAEEEFERRKREREARRRGTPTTPDVPPESKPETRPGQRQQPKRKPRQKRSGASGGPADGASGEPTDGAGGGQADGAAGSDGSGPRKRPKDLKDSDPEEPDDPAASAAS
jgi:YidC/Oxa1 family membrane protein insertase